MNINNRSADSGYDSGYESADSGSKSAKIRSRSADSGYDSGYESADSGSKLAKTRSRSAKTKYESSKIKIYIDGVDLTEYEDIKNCIQYVSVEESLHLPSVCLITFSNNLYSLPGREDWLWKDDHSLLGYNKPVEIAMESAGTVRHEGENLKKVFSGEIASITFDFNEKSAAPGTIVAYDLSHRLHRGRHTRSFQNETDSGIVTKIAGEMGISTGRIEPSLTVHRHVAQQNQTNMEFLRERAFLNGFELYVQDNMLNFRPPPTQGKLTSLKLLWQEDVTNFRVTHDSTEQVDNVEVRAWDYRKKKTITALGKKEKVSTENKRSSEQEVSRNSKRKSKVTVVDYPASSEAEAKVVAQGIYRRLKGEHIRADAEGVGNPRIRAGVKIEINKDMGKYGGEYYVTEAYHSFPMGGEYRTSFSVRGLKAGNLLELLSPSRNLKPSQTFLVGIVTNNNDPMNLGRVKLKFHLSPDYESDWARVVSIGAGKNRGFDCLPEVNDEVLVGFEHGNIHRPYVIGGVWNGVDLPPTPVTNSVVKNKVRLRTIKTRTGHTFQFVEEDKSKSKAGIYLKTAGGHQVNLNDSQKMIEITTVDGHKITMRGKGKKRGRPASINIKSTGSLNIQAKTDINLNAKGNIRLKGKQIHLN